MKRALAVLVATTVVLGLPGGASAAGAPRLAEAQSARFPDRAWVLTLPKRIDLRPSDLEIRENGRRADDVQVLAGGEKGSDAFGVVLAIDASLSMRGEPIADALAAARAFAERRRSEQQLGLLFFSREQHVGLPLTTDGARIDAALAREPRMSTGTGIYDAGIAAIEMLRESDVAAGSVIVLSDGADTGSLAGSVELSEAAAQAKVRFYTVGFKSAAFSGDTLNTIAADTGGVYAQADTAGQLKAVYAALGDQFSREYLVSYRSHATLGSDVGVEARVRGFAEPAVANYTAPALGVPTAVAAPEPGPWQSVGALVAVVAVVAFLLALAAWLLVRGPLETVPSRIIRYTGGTATEPSSPFDGEAGGTLMSRVGERAFRRTPWWPRFVEAVELSGIRLSPGQLAALTMFGTLALMWLAVAGARPVAAVILAGTPVLVHIVLRARIDKLRKAFADQLADNLQVVASAMRAGHSFEGGLAVAADDAPEPMRSELKRVVNDERLGVPLDDAMAVVARRMASKEVDQVAMVVMAQRHAGGNVAELLDRAVDSLRHRAELRRMVQTLTAQGRAGGAIVTAMPFVMALILSLLSPGFFEPMLDNTAGVIVLMVAGAMVATGWFVIRKLVDIKV